jgi:hypothetical protein
VTVYGASWDLRLFYDDLSFQSVTIDDVFFIEMPSTLGPPVIHDAIVQIVIDMLRL